MTKQIDGSETLLQVDETPVRRVVVADDQPVVRQGLATIFGVPPDFEVVGTAADGHALLDVISATRPDIAVVDVRMPRLDGIAATRQIARDYPQIRVIVLTTYDLDEYVYEALHAGASGFMLKDTPAERLVEGVRLVADGSMLLGPTVTRRLVADFARRETAHVPVQFDALTRREIQVVRALASGLSNAEIAAELTISEETVKSHVSEVLRKTGCRDRVQVVIAAYEAGLNQVAPPA
ncbi:response regulator transcription factor [Cellulosimicrobium cellulans]|uniref:response regulator transcription factor n=1 Tax=Cellulosimicrobium cellulans TaxID=1710 RepID=UPI0020CFC444|nr:response regulator transcription factor [Cellulosimicrobium cellulans]